MLHKPALVDDKEEGKVKSCAADKKKKAKSSSHSWVWPRKNRIASPEFFFKLFGMAGKLLL